MPASNQVMPRQHPFNIIFHIILHNNKTLKWFISLIWYPYKIMFPHYVLHDEMNKIRSHLHIFFKKLNYLIAALNFYHPFVPVKLIMLIFFIFLIQYDSRQSNWRHLLPFHSPVPPLLRSTSSHCCTVSRFISIELRRADCLRFIFQQCFIPSPPLSSRN
jgi:hypothetical protein